MGSSAPESKPEPLIDIIGMGMSPDDLTAAHLRLIERADVLAGGRRHLARFRDRVPEAIEITADLPALVEQIRRRTGRRVVVLASGDPLFYGIGAYLAKALGREKVRIHPNVSSVAAAFARMGEPWQDCAVVSLHGRSQAETLARALAAADRIAVFTDPHHSPAWVGRFLQQQRLEDVRIGVFECMGAEDEAVSWHTPSTLADQTFRSPNMLVIKREKGPPAVPERLHLGMPESAFAHEEGLITKAEIRAVALSRLNLVPGVILWDLGAGSGAVAIEASLLMPGGRLWAVEKKPERVAQINSNRRRYGVANLEVVQAELPAGLEALPDPDRVFIGGSGRALRDTIDRVCRRLREGGIVVVNTVLFDSLNDTLARFKAHGLATDVLQIQIGRSRPLAGSDRLEALNPVWVIRGNKQGEN